jgi:hypothetical protein
MSAALNTIIAGEDIDTLKHYIPPFEAVPVMVWHEEHATQFMPDPSFQLLEILLMATIEDTARVFLKEDSVVVIAPDSLFNFPGAAFLDTLVSLDSHGYFFDVIDLRNHSIIRNTAFWVVVRHGGEGIPFFSDKPDHGSYKVDLTSDVINGDYSDWDFTGAYKSIAILVDRDPVTIDDKDGRGEGSEDGTNSITVLQNYPNPANPFTIIPLQMNITSKVMISLYDVRGRLVRVLHNGEIHEGFHRIIWDGRNSRGEEVISGIYFCEVKGDHSSRVLKMLISK